MSSLELVSEPLINSTRFHVRWKAHFSLPILPGRRVQWSVLVERELTVDMTIYFTAKQSNATYLVPKLRITSNEGFFDAQQRGDLLFFFDNSFSTFRSKDVALVTTQLVMPQILLAAAHSKLLEIAQFREQLQRAIEICPTEAAGGREPLLEAAELFEPIARAAEATVLPALPSGFFDDLTPADERLEGVPLQLVVVPESGQGQWHCGPLDEWDEYDDEGNIIPRER